jgi:hypothetical protein
MSATQRFSPTLAHLKESFNPPSDPTQLPDSVAAGTGTFALAIVFLGTIGLIFGTLCWVLLH